MHSESHLLLSEKEMGLPEREPTVAEVSRKIKDEYLKRIAETQKLPEAEKKVLIIDCSIGDPDPETNSGAPTRAITLADERLGASNTRAILASKNPEYPDSLDDIAGVIISGSNANIEGWRDDPKRQWIGKTEEFIKKALEKNIPVMGICFGMQLVADVNGKDVPKNIGGLEKGAWKTSIFTDVEKTNHPIFKGMQFQTDQGNENASALIDVVGAHDYRVSMDGVPKSDAEGYSYPAHTYDFDSLDPADAEGTKASPMINIDGSFVGVQFHPEFATPLGVEMQKASLSSPEVQNKFAASNQDPNSVRDRLNDYEFGSVNDSRKFLTNFVDICFEKED